MTQQQGSPFARVSNGYDPQQVAAFAAEALSWKKELNALRSEIAAAGELVARYESAVGSIEEVERETVEVVGDAERCAAEIIEAARQSALDILESAKREASAIRESAHSRTPEFTPDPATTTQTTDTGPDDAAAWLATPDPVESIFEPIDEEQLVDAETDRERRIAAATANLWKRRGVLAPPE